MATAARGRLVARRAERQVPRRALRRPVPAPALALREPGRLLVRRAASTSRRRRSTTSTRWPASSRASAGRCSAACRPSVVHVALSTVSGARRARRPGSSTSGALSAPSRTSSDLTRIEVRDLAQAYRLGERDVLHGTLREAIAGAARARRSTARAAARRDRETLWALDDVSLRRRARRGARHHRPERRRQDHAAEDPLPDHRADRGRGAHLGPRRLAARGRHRLPPRADRPREHLPERRDPRHAAARDRAQVRRDRRVRRGRALHRHAGQALLERDVRAARVRGRGAPRARDPDRRRGARGRRRGVPAQVPRQDGRGQRARAGRCCSSATTWRRSPRSPTAASGSTQGACARSGDPAADRRRVPARGTRVSEPGYADLTDPELRARRRRSRRTGEVLFESRAPRRRGRRDRPASSSRASRCAIELGLRVASRRDRLEVLLKFTTLEGMLVFTLTSGIARRRPRPGRVRAAGRDPERPLRRGRYTLDLYVLTSVAAGLPATARSSSRSSARASPSARPARVRATTSASSTSSRSGARSGRGR